jgi:putative flippase GtrA
MPSTTRPNQRKRSLLQQFGKFGLTGFCSSLVHFTTVMLLVNCAHLIDAVLHVPFHIALIALCANVAAFLIAFTISYEGHSNWTFAPKDGQTALNNTALQRFFMVAVMSFALNESLYAVLLRCTHMNYALALILVISAVSMLTFSLSKSWAFKSC